MWICGLQSAICSRIGRSAEPEGSICPYVCVTFRQMDLGVLQVRVQIFTWPVVKAFPWLAAC